MEPPKVLEVIKMLEADEWRLVRCKRGRRIYRKGNKVVTIHGNDNHVLTIGTWKAIQKQADW